MTASVRSRLPTPAQAKGWEVVNQDLGNVVGAQLSQPRGWFAYPRELVVGTGLTAAPTSQVSV